MRTILILAMGFLIGFIMCDTNWLGLEKEPEVSIIYVREPDDFMHGLKLSAPSQLIYRMGGVMEIDTTRIPRINQQP